MMGYLRRRKTRKRAVEILRHARHLQYMRGDTMSAQQLDGLMQGRQALSEQLRAGDPEGIERAGDTLTQQIVKLTPVRFFPAVRENVEVIVVAIAVAMAFRTYFIQPFKIPTGSMQPTLYGITAVDRNEPDLTDRQPFKLVKWFSTGQWYREVKTKTGGTLAQVRDQHGRPYVSPNYPGDRYYVVSGKRYRIPKNAKLNYELGKYVPRGAVLWSGTRTAGDHVFVDKIRWNFRRPRRGEIMVFSTKGISALEATLPRDRHNEPMSTHYIKRMVGLPGERIAIDPPRLLVDGTEVRSPRGIRRIVDQEPGYAAGYQVIGYRQGYLRRAGDEYRLADAEYFACGDNQRNSRDSRYWGSVPEANLVGPSFLVYWPFSRRWGLTH